MNLITVSAAVACAAVLGLSGIKKALAADVFREQLADYRLLPYGMTGGAAVALIATEISAAVLLAIPAMRQAGGALAGTLFAAFLLAMTSTLLRGRRIACGCFGTSGELDVVGAPTVVRASLLLLLAAVAALPPSSTFPGAPATVALGATFVAAVFLVPELVRLIQMIPESSHLVRIHLENDTAASL